MHMRQRDRPDACAMPRAVTGSGVGGSPGCIYAGFLLGCAAPLASRWGPRLLPGSCQTPDRKPTPGKSRLLTRARAVGARFRRRFPVRGPARPDEDQRSEFPDCSACHNGAVTASRGPAEGARVGDARIRVRVRLMACWFLLQRRPDFIPRAVKGARVGEARIRAPRRDYDAPTLTTRRSHPPLPARSGLTGRKRFNSVSGSASPARHCPVTGSQGSPAPGGTLTGNPPWPRCDSGAPALM